VETIRIHSSGRRFYVLCWIAIIVGELILIASGLINGGLMSIPFGLIFAVPSFMLLLKVARESIELTPEGIVVRRFGSRRIRWSDIADLRVHETGIARQAQIVEHGQRVRRLPVPCDPWPLREARFDEKFEQLRRYWTAHR
jgi:hypothetical protein